MHGHGYKPESFNKWKQRRERGACMLFGIELEIEKRRRDKDTQAPLSYMESIAFVDEAIDEAFPDESFFYTKSDGSLSSGVEIVSHPMTLAYWTRHERDFQSLFAKIQKRFYIRQTCGFHVHVGRAGLNNTEIGNIRYLLNCPLLRFFESFSKRGNNIDAFRYCKFELFSNFIDYYSGYTDGRYKALNLSNRDTIEFRIFRGTISYFRVEIVLRAITQLISFAKMMRPDELKAEALTKEQRNGMRDRFIKYAVENDKVLLKQKDFRENYQRIINNAKVTEGSALQCA